MKRNWQLMSIALSLNISGRDYLVTSLHQRLKKWWTRIRRSSLSIKEISLYCFDWFFRWIPTVSSRWLPNRQETRATRNVWKSSRLQNLYQMTGEKLMRISWEMLRLKLRRLNGFNQSGDIYVYDVNTNTNTILPQKKKPNICSPTFSSVPKNRIAND